MSYVSIKTVFTHEQFNRFWSRIETLALFFVIVSNEELFPFGVVLWGKIMHQ